MGCENSKPAPTAAEIIAAEKRMEAREREDRDERARILADSTPLSVPQVAPSIIRTLDGFEWTQALDREVATFIALYQYCNASNQPRRSPDMSKSTMDQAFIAHSVLSTRYRLGEDSYGHIEFYHHHHPSYLWHRFTLPRELCINHSTERAMFGAFCHRYCSDFNRCLLVRLTEKQIPFTCQTSPRGEIVRIDITPPTTPVVPFGTDCKQ